MPKEKKIGPDIVRAVACVFVLAVHFYMYTGFYDRPYSGYPMIISVPIRMLFMTCVPMFMILTGYLCGRKTWSFSYYRGLVGTLVTYFLCSLCVLVFRRIYYGEMFSVLGMFRRILEYSAAPYAWYVEMYIGLFLLCPFLNAMWNGLDKKARGALVITCLTLSCVPTLLNFHYKILPSWWEQIYPLAYYFVGAWVREYPVKIKKRWLALGLVCTLALTCTFQHSLYRDVNFNWNPTNLRNGLFVAVMSILLFIILINTDGEKFAKPVKWCIRKIADLSFAVYLLSYIGDILVYDRLMARFPLMEDAVKLHLPCVVIVLIISCVIAYPIQLATKGIIRLLPFSPKKETVSAADNKN